MNKQQERKYKELYRKWLVRGGLGALLIGTGLSGLLEVALMKHNYTGFWVWFSLGTLAFIIIMSGLSIMIDALRFKIMFLNLKRESPDTKQKL